jgi:predicted enzyme related to lactoylglutathione lyase
MERTVLPGMVTLAQFQDPAGNVIGLTESEVPPSS